MPLFLRFKYVITISIKYHIWVRSNLTTHEERRKVNSPLRALELFNRVGEALILLKIGNVI